MIHRHIRQVPLSYNLFTDSMVCGIALVERGEVDITVVTNATNTKP